MDEGFLTKLKNKLVNGDTLGNLGHSMGFSKYMIISKYIDDQCDGRNNIRILEDIFEAFIGALFIDCQNYEMIKRYIISVFESKINFGELIINDTNYKDQLLRYFQNNFKEQPIYNSTRVDDQYTTIVYKNSEQYGVGIAKTKKKSEQESAKNTLIQLGLLN